MSVQSRRPPRAVASSTSPFGKGDDNKRAKLVTDESATLSEVHEQLHKAFQEVSDGIAAKISWIRECQEQSRQRLDEERARVATRKAELDALNGSAQDERNVELCVSGRTFHTTTRALCAVPDTIFSLLFSSSEGAEGVPEEDRFFLDRDPEVFAIILEYLEAQSLQQSFSLKKGMQKDIATRISAEADFYGLDGLKRMAINCTALVVSQDVDSPFTTIGSALAAAVNGDRIVVCQGTYQESLEINKRVEICGDGPMEGVIIESTEEAPTITFCGNGGGVLRNLTLTEASTFRAPCLEVKDNASVLVDHCELSTRQSANAINVIEMASITVLDSRIHAVKASAIFLRDYATAVLRNNVMSHLGSCGIFTRHNTRFYIEGNEISHAALGGIDVNDNSTGTIDNNTICNCGRGGVVMYGNSHTRVKGNRIMNNEYGMRSFEDSEVILNNNIVCNNTFEDLQGRAIREALSNTKLNMQHPSPLIPGIPYPDVVLEDMEIA